MSLSYQERSELKRKRNIIALVFLFLPFLLYGAYNFGYWSLDGEHKTNRIPVVHLEVMSSRLDGCYIMVKDTKTGAIGELESYSCYHAHRFEDGEYADMELWHQEGSHSVDFVFKGDGVHTEETYHEASYIYTFQEKEIDSYGN